METIKIKGASAFKYLEQLVKDRDILNEEILNVSIALNLGGYETTQPVKAFSEYVDAAKANPLYNENKRLIRENGALRRGIEIQRTANRSREADSLKEQLSHCKIERNTAESKLSGILRIVE